jgi:hypothetical protein
MEYLLFSLSINLTESRVIITRATSIPSKGEIEIQIMDYNQSVMGYSTATAMFGMNIQVENDQEKSGTFDTGVDGVRGYEQVSKTEQRAELMYAIADRFFLTIKSNGSNDADALKRIAKSMKLSELASK